MNWYFGDSGPTFQRERGFHVALGNGRKQPQLWSSTSHVSSFPTRASILLDKYLVLCCRRLQIAILNQSLVRWCGCCFQFMPSTIPPLALTGNRIPAESSPLARDEIPPYS